MISWRLGGAFAALAILVLALIATSVHFAVAYVHTRLDIGELQTESRRVALEGARLVHAEVIIGVGELTLTGGAEELMDAEFRYYTPPLFSTMTYTVTGEQGTLTLLHASPDVVPTFERPPQFRSKSVIQFNNDVPLVLSVAVGVNEGHLRFDGLNLYQLNLATTVGDAEFDLRGAWKRSFAVSIEGGIGETLVRLPSNTGVRVQFGKQEDGDKIRMDGLTQAGDFYVNDAWGKTMSTLEITVEADEGEIRLEVEP
ncbi:MAG: hypothetical protein IT328_13625 [Caldilineaceae bacterium]|nr:hypothetical protein [Caldilineaceae bacterium]